GHWVPGQPPAPRAASPGPSRGEGEPGPGRTHRSDHRERGAHGGPGRDGLLHFARRHRQVLHSARPRFQGAHSQGQFVIDGQTISDQTGVTFSNSIDPGIAQSIEVVYGNVLAEYGEKVGTVVNMTTRSGLAAPFALDVYGGGARYSTYEAGLSAAGGSRNWGAFASLNGSRSDRFLDPVNFDNLHNDGDSLRGFLRLDYASPSLNDLVRVTALL